MKIAVTSTGKEMTSKMDQHFGRAGYFMMVDSETLEFEIVENSQNLNLSQGAGIQAGKTMVDNKVNVLITGNCGPKAFQVLNHAGIQVVTGVEGKIINVVHQYKNGELMSAKESNVEGHWV